MTLDEAICHCEEVAEQAGDCQCANDHRQLAEWLKDYQRLLLERKKGKWVRYDGDWLKTMCKCSECGAMIDINEKYRNFFCYHCGVRIEENNESD